MKEIKSRGEVWIESQDNDLLRKKVYVEIIRQDKISASIGELGLIKQLHAYSDLINKKNVEKNPPQCKRGCSFCCHIPVHLSGAEAKALSGRITNEQRYQLRFQYGKKNYFDLPYAARACVFLKNGECSVYEDRPLTCRNYYAYTDPKLCNTSDNQINMVATANIDELEVQNLALCIRTGSGFLPDLILENKP